MIALALALVGCAEEVTRPPADLVHVWRSDAPHMRGRSLEIRDEYVIFAADRYTSDLYALLRVEESPRRVGTHYLIHYRGKGGEERPLGLLYKPGSPPTLQLDHREEIWVREQDARWLQKASR